MVLECALPSFTEGSISNWTLPGVGGLLERRCPARGELGAELPAAAPEADRPSPLPADLRGGQPTSSSGKPSPAALLLPAQSGTGLCLGPPPPGCLGGILRGVVPAAPGVPTFPPGLRPTPGSELGPEAALPTLRASIPVISVCNGSFAMGTERCLGGQPVSCSGRASVPEV